MSEQTPSFFSRHKILISLGVVGAAVAAIVFIAVQFFSKHWLIATIIAFFVGGTSFFPNLFKKSPEKQIAELKVELNQCVTTRDTYAVSIHRLNEQVTMWQAVTEDQQKQFDKLQSSVASTKKQYDTKIQRLLKESKPKTCEASIQYLIDTGRANPWVRAQ